MFSRHTLTSELRISKDHSVIEYRLDEFSLGMKEMEGMEGLEGKRSSRDSTCAWCEAETCLDLGARMSSSRCRCSFIRRTKMAP